MDHGILTTRYNNDTFMQSIIWRQTNNYTGCIYNLKTRISNTNLYDKPYFVLEMNNTTNLVMGIGVIENKISIINESIYINCYLNRYTYKGTIRKSINKDNFSVSDKLYFETQIEDVLFKGKGHMKRGQSMTHFPKHKITDEHIIFLKRIVYEE